MKTAKIEGQAEKVQAFDSGLACGLLLITDRKREQELGKRLSEPRLYKIDADTEKTHSSSEVRQDGRKLLAYLDPSLATRQTACFSPTLDLFLVSPTRHDPPIWRRR